MLNGLKLILFLFKYLLILSVMDFISKAKYLRITRLLKISVSNYLNFLTFLIFIDKNY